jgi:outer membrane murein-binding lipoprotein Lpp
MGYTRMAMAAVLLLALVLSGCASHARRTAELLEQDYKVMNDEQLLHYYYQLNDQIARVEQARSGTSIGVGYGRAPVSIGVGTGVARGVIAEDLRDRRTEVRTELAVRELRP